MFGADQYGYGYPPPADAMARPFGQGYPGIPGSVQSGQQAQGRAQRGAFICCPVTSREEAVATRVEAFGPGILMPDFGHGMIYYKRFNEKTALADFGEFRYVPPEQETQAAPQSSGMDYAGVISAFSGRLDGISNQLKQLLQRLDPAAPADDGKESGQHERRT